MPRILTAILATALSLPLAPMVQAQQIDPLVIAKDLLLPCQEADNDPRDGYVVQLECVQFIRGFTAGLAEAGEDFCLPEANTDDLVRRGFVSWVHSSYTSHSKMPVGAALHAMLTEKFPCN